jgi:hypothetical protein
MHTRCIGYLPSIAPRVAHHWLKLSVCPNSSVDSSTLTHCLLVIIRANIKAPWRCNTVLMHTCSQERHSQVHWGAAAVAAIG